MAEIDSIVSRFSRIASEYRDKPVLLAEGGLGKAWTYGEVLSRVKRIAGGLVASDLVDENGIGLMSENCPEWPIAYLSILTAGATVVPIDANLRPEEISYIIGHSRIRTVIASPVTARTLKDLRLGLNIFVITDDQPESWNQLHDHEPIEGLIADNPQAALIYTSGTTGAPKAVQLSHKNLLANVDGIQLILKIHDHDRFYSILPLHHTFEATAGFILPILSGASIIYARSLKSRDILEDIGRTKCTLMIGVPLLFEKMHHNFIKRISEVPKHQQVMFQTFMAASRIGWKLGGRPGKRLFRPLRRKAGLDSIRIFCSGGAPLPPHISEFFNMLGFDFLQGYGMTEASPVISVNRPENIEFGSVGPPIGNVEVRIDNPTSDGIGEIVVRGDSVTSGYKDNPKLTEELICDGWLHTGDLGRMYNGHIWITGRGKNVIVSAAGKNIYPEELEEKLLESDLVMEAIVFGRNRETRQGEEVRALIVPNMESIATRFGISETTRNPEKIREIFRDVIAGVNQRVAEFKRISAFDLQFEELAKTSTRKVKRYLYS
ncbi:MAG TPA: AMP-binding protein [candidate division Zixibacteria bacterium]|nr:AMP-binding protein [candidate division Zixibacteria bacterium]